MDFKDFTAQEMANYINNKKGQDDEWFEIAAWIDNFLKNNPSAEEKKLFVPLGCAEVVTIICDGLWRMKNSICFNCKRRHGKKYDGECEIYSYPEGIPKEIWNVPDGKCPHYK